MNNFILYPFSVQLCMLVLDSVEGFGLTLKEIRSNGGILLNLFLVCYILCIRVAYSIVLVFDNLIDYRFQ